MPPKKRRKVSPDEFVVRLRDSQNILEHKRLLEVYNVNFIRNNGENLSYVYYIVESIVGCKVDLLRRADGEDADDDDGLWKTCKRDDLIRGGVYLVNCPDEALEIYPELGHLAKGGQGSRPGSRRGASDSPNRNRNVRDTKTGVESEVSNSTPAAEDLNLLPFRKLKPAYAQSEFESTLIKRDAGCVVTGTSPDQCLKSHIVPKALINARAGIIDGYYVESYDPATAIMLCPDIDRMFDAFQCSAYMGGSSI